MVYLIIALIVAFIITAIIMKIKLMTVTDKPPFANILMGFMLYFIIISVICNVIAGIITPTITEDAETTTRTEVVESNELLTLKDQNQTEANLNGFFLGIGYVDGKSSEEMYYCFYEKTEYGYKYEELSSKYDNVYIGYWKQGDIPRVEVEKDIATKQKIIVEEANWWTTSPKEYKAYKDYNIGDYVSMSEETVDERIIIYVPENSIINNYNIDME